MSEPVGPASGQPAGAPAQQPGGIKTPKQGTFRERRKRRRAAKKRRIAAMSTRRRIGRRVGIIATWLLGLLALTMVGTVVLFYTLSNVPRPETLPLPQTAEIDYSDGTLLAKIGTVDSTPVPISKVPLPVRWDVLAAEDRKFYSEPGVSVTGTLRAALNDLRGGDTQGGSGITQQYVKNAYLNNSRTLSRKLKELAIAVKLNREYTKDQILEFYLNTVYFGRGAYGIEAAAQAYFKEDVTALTTSQGALLAALLRAPTYYDPDNNAAAAKQRWQYVIQGMVDTKHLTPTEAAAQVFPKVIAPKSGLGAAGPKAIIVDRVIAELAAHGISETELYAKGLRIRTTINRQAQAAAESAIRTTFSGLTAKQKNMKNALIAIAPSTGAVLAYYGGPAGKNYAGTQDDYDYASLGSASPGSSFKPYTLATALSQTLAKKSTLTISSIVDGSQCVTIQATRICNDPSDKAYSSSHVSVANAMKYSLNTTFDQMAAKVGPANVATTARAAGISKTINGKPSLTNSSGQTTFGIGIGDFPVHPIDQAVGFATFANGGTANAAYFVQSATSPSGSVVYQHKAAGTRAVDAKVANDVTLSLEPIARFSGVPLADGRESAAKTGTEGIMTGKDSGGNSDAWLVGYTPQVSTAVWVGSGNSTTAIVNAAGNPEYGRDLPGRTWQLFMNTWLANQPKLDLPSKQLITSTSSTTTAAPSSSAPPSSDSSVPSVAPSSPPTSESSSTQPPSSDPPSSPTPSDSSPSPSPSCTGGLLNLTCAGSSASTTPSG